MDQEEIQKEIDKLVTFLGLPGEELFSLAIALERIRIFQNLQTLIQQKDSANDKIATEVLAWAWQALADK